MAQVNIKISNLSAIKKAFKQAPDLMAKELNLAIKKTLISIQAETIKNVHPDRGINIITGGLLAATERPPIFTNLKGVYEIDISYGIYVHEGTRYMRPRPFLKNAVDSQNRDIDDFFTKAVDNVLNKISSDTNGISEL